MTDPLYVQPDGVRSYAQIHDEVVGALSQLLGTAAPEALGWRGEHARADRVGRPRGALSQVLGRRHGTLQATSTSAQTISVATAEGRADVRTRRPKGRRQAQGRGRAMTGGAGSQVGAGGPPPSALAPARAAPKWWGRWSARSGNSRPTRTIAVRTHSRAATDPATGHAGRAAALAQQGRAAGRDKAGEATRSGPENSPDAEDRAPSEESVHARPSGRACRGGRPGLPMRAGARLAPRAAPARPAVDDRRYNLRPRSSSPRCWMLRRFDRGGAPPASHPWLRSNVR